jgi:hypothetical protein
VWADMLEGVGLRGGGRDRRPGGTPCSGWTAARGGRRNILVFGFLKGVIQEINRGFVIVFY